MPSFKIKNVVLSKFVLLIILSVIVSPDTIAREVIDVTQEKVNLIDEPKRVITLAPSLGEIAAELLGKNFERIVGVSEYTDYPPGLKKVKSIGPFMHFNLETVVALKPDLVFATTDGNSKEQVTHLRELGIPVVVVKTENLSDIASSIRLIAKSLNRGVQGERMAVAFQNGLEKVRNGAKNKPRYRVIVQLSEQPLVVAGKGSFIQDGLEVVGAENIYRDSTIHYPRPSLEDVLAKNPDVIIIMNSGGDQQYSQRVIENWGLHKNLNAIKNHRIYVITSDELLRPTPRFLSGLSKLSRILYEKK